MTQTRDFGADLAASLASITGQALTCEFDVPKNPDGKPLDPNKVNVHYTKGDGSAFDILQDTTKACEGGAEGWQYNADKTKIILCGNVCREVKADTGAKVDIVLGCKTVVIPA